MRLLSYYLSFFFCGLAATLAGQSPQLEPTTYTAASGRVVQAENGTLSVSERRSDPAARTINLSFVRLKSTAEQPAAPLVYLAGGPGSGATWMAANPRRLEAWLPVLAVCDVILLDQRGTGAAGRELTYIDAAGPSPELFVSEVGAREHFLGMSERALAHWREAGIDLAGYTTPESARDIDELRRALALDRISLMGFSYGTHLGQAYLKYHGRHVERAILAGVEGLGETFKTPLTLDAHFRKLAALVAADPAVGDDVPDLVQLYQEVAAQLEETPLTLTLRSPLTGEDLAVQVGKFGLDFILFMDLGDASDLPVIPRMLYQLREGDASAFQWFVQKRLSMGYGLHAMAVTMDICSGVSATRRARITAEAERSLFGNVVNTPYLALADVWPVPALPDEYRADFTSTVPTLLLSGTLDRNTPPFQAERLRWSLPNARHIVVRNAGHEQILPHPVVEEAVVKFLRGEDVGELTAAYPPIRFLPVRGEVTEEERHPALGE